MHEHASVDAILFDLDGTLADTTEDIRYALARAFDALGVQPLRPVDHLVDGSPLEELFAVAVPDAGPTEFEAFVAHYRHHYEHAPERRSRLYPGVAPTLHALRAHREPAYRLAVATNKRGPAARNELDRLGVSAHFDLIEGTGGSGVPPKPAPDLLLSICDRLGVPPQRALMVGDTVRDLVAGQRAGMRTAAVTYGLGPAEHLLGARPDYLLEEFDELLVVLGLQDD